jgi:hypothetical protein
MIIGSFEGEAGLMLHSPRAPVQAILCTVALITRRRNPAIRRFYGHLRNDSKPPKVALLARVRKLPTMPIAMLKHQTASERNRY